MSRQQFTILLGFAFTAIWITRDLGDAVLCLVGGAIFYAIDAYLRGELDLNAIGDRVQRSDAPR